MNIAEKADFECTSLSTLAVTHCFLVWLSDGNYKCQKQLMQEPMKIQVGLVPTSKFHRKTQMQKSLRKDAHESRTISAFWSFENR